MLWNKGCCIFKLNDISPITNNTCDTWCVLVMYQAKRCNGYLGSSPIPSKQNGLQRALPRTSKWDQPVQCHREIPLLYVQSRLHGTSPAVSEVFCIIYHGKMPSVCSVFHCSNGRTEASLHEWPKDPVTGEKWTNFVASSRAPADTKSQKRWTPLKTSTICSAHFRYDSTIINICFPNNLYSQLI